MARTKKEEIIEETKETKTKTTTKKEETKEETKEPVKKEEVKETVSDSNGQKKIFLKVDTPYVAVPTLNSNVAGILKAGKVLFVEEEIDNGEYGSFYKVGLKTYINRKCDVEVF